MIEVLRRKLWESIYLNPVSPGCLMLNLNDPDYKSVECINSDEGLHITLSFEDAGECITTVYNFDSKELLLNVVMSEQGCETVLFDRQKQIEDILKEINHYKNENLSTLNLQSA